MEMTISYRDLNFLLLSLIAQVHPPEKPREEVLQDTARKPAKC